MSPGRGTTKTVQRKVVLSTAQRSRSRGQSREDSEISVRTAFLEPTAKRLPRQPDRPPPHLTAAGTSQKNMESDTASQKSEKSTTGQQWSEQEWKDWRDGYSKVWTAHDWKVWRTKQEPVRPKNHSPQPSRDTWLETQADVDWIRNRYLTEQDKLEAEARDIERARRRGVQS